MLNNVQAPTIPALLSTQFYSSFFFVKVEKKDEEIEALKEDLQELKDQVAAAEEGREKATDKEDRLLEECEKLNQAVDDLEDQLKAVSVHCTFYLITLQ